MNIFVVLPGNAQWSFLMGTTACQGENLPLPPCLLCWDTGSHPKDRRQPQSLQFRGKAGLTHTQLCRGALGAGAARSSRQAGIFPQATSLQCSQRQLHLRADFRIGQARIWGRAVSAGWRAACLVWVRVCNANRAPPAAHPSVPSLRGARGAQRGPV